MSDRAKQAGPFAKYPARAKALLNAYDALKAREGEGGIARRLREPGGRRAIDAELVRAVADGGAR
jgi:hypothetical protein